MTWRKNSQSLPQIQELGLLTTRLLRLEIFNKLVRGETQLGTLGGPPIKISEAYREYMRKEIKHAVPEAEPEKPVESLLKITGKSEF